MSGLSAIPLWVLTKVLPNLPPSMRAKFPEAPIALPPISRLPDGEDEGEDEGDDEEEGGDGEDEGGVTGSGSGSWSGSGEKERRRRHGGRSRGQRRQRRSPRKTIAKEDKRTGKVNKGYKRHHTDCEKQAFAVAYYDSLPKEKDGRKRSVADLVEETRLHARWRDGTVLVSNCNTFKGWITTDGRKRIEVEVKRKIADFAPHAAKIIHRGGRGCRAPGRGIKVRNITGRRRARYPEAEEEAVAWMRDKRERGIKITARILKGAMKGFVRTLNPQGSAGHGAALAFKASSGWMKRFMGRFRISWRRRNDNAKQSAAQLMPPVGNFIRHLREFRLDNPSVPLAEEDDQLPNILAPRNANPGMLLGDLVRDDTSARIDALLAEIYCKYGPYNTLNVDQHPLPFASNDPCTLEFVGTQRVWIRQPGSGLDKRQATLQLLVRALGRQPKPCLLFKGAPVPGEQWRKHVRAAEMLQYDKDVVVLWQAKAWADSATCVVWAKGPFADFVRESLAGGESLVLADNLGAQIKDEFTAAMSEGRATMRLGPAGATHVWQPCDHHLGREYGRRMGIYYDAWMAAEYDKIADGKVSTEQRRILLTKWCGQAYRELEEEREAKEGPWLAAMLDPPTWPEPWPEPSRFFKAFLRTGCLVTRDGSQDEEIRPHQEIKGELLDELHRLFQYSECEQVALEEGAAADGYEGDSDEREGDRGGDGEGERGGDSDGEGERSGNEWNSDDDDDEELDVDGDGEQEPVPDDMVLQLPEEEEEDEADLIRKAKAAVHATGSKGEIRDFSMAQRMALGDSIAVAPVVGARDAGYNARKNKIYNEQLSAFKASHNGKAPSVVRATGMWEAAGEAATQDEEEVEGGSSSRRSKRLKRK
jgi:hypothetical protein